MTTFKESALAAMLLIGFCCVGVGAHAQDYTVEEDISRQILSRLVVWRNPLTGLPAYVRWCRQKPMGCAKYVNQNAVLLVGLAEHYDVDPYLLAAMAWHETRWNDDAVGAAGEVGLLQLLPRAKWGRHAARLCREYPQSCDLHRMQIAVDLMARCLQKCKDIPNALGLYNTGKCQVNKYSKIVMKHYEDMQLGAK